jgi:hypothetical protein
MNALRIAKPSTAFAIDQLRVISCTYIVSFRVAWRCFGKDFRQPLPACRLVSENRPLRNDPDTSSSINNLGGLFPKYRIGSRTIRRIGAGILEKRFSFSAGHDISVSIQSKAANNQTPRSCLELPAPWSKIKKLPFD